MRRAGLGLLLALASGCGRLGFDSRDGGGGDASTGDAPVDAVGGDCWASWRAGTQQLSTPTLVAELTTDQAESNPSLSSDGLTLYFDRGAGINRDLMVSTRASPGTPWGEIDPLEPLNGPEDDTRVTVSADGRVAIFASTREAGSFDLLEARRASTAVPFELPTDTAMQNVNTPLNDVDPELTADGLRLYLAPEVGPAEQRIKLATRSSVDEPFGLPQMITGLVGFPTVFDPTLSPDELVIVFSVLDPTIDLYVAVRPTRTGAFSAATLLPISTSFIDGDAELSSDGCELFFASNRDGNRNIWVTTVEP